MDYKALNQQVGNIDLYLLDQVLKGRFEGYKKILDAGCGEGRNLKYFANNGCDLYGIDTNAMAIKMLQMSFPAHKENFKAGSIENMEFDDDYFDLIICSAVLHFAEDEDHFKSMLEAMVRALKPTGTLFIRTASADYVGTEKAEDQGFTFLLTKELLEEVTAQLNLRLLEPFKAVVVLNKRSMAVLVLEKGI
ncbi:class I SAM-dependent methyltransferase [Fulvivirga sp. RKSG066]|uniref:class I SAM-dependent methyltransferase n=1 Tax=Fulvivirga aurantia TaxID=2529383 RepID=UPI0012BD54FA|nr:class I SAM-dependent methyltransferase [Fulvivirga aurantia]MTI22338.1 class I SAM-dependent methyltransferase [Fulvivirga aurantia]